MKAKRVCWQIPFSRFTQRFGHLLATISLDVRRGHVQGPIARVGNDVLFIRLDDRLLFHGALFGHLPPAVLAHHVGLQARRAHHRPRVDGVARLGHSLRRVHEAELHRSASRVGQISRRVGVLRASRWKYLPEELSGSRAQLFPLLHFPHVHPRDPLH